ncbi:MAG: hypothetical protein JWO38_1927 [Gemmataceae bacterium]|nr:hypothetical protein [Gemmataceae bacterium]
MSNVEKLRRAYQMWHDSLGRNHEAWLAILDEDVVMGSLADGAAGMKFSAPRRGHAEVRRYFAELAEDWEMLFYNADEFVETGDRIVMIGRGAWRSRKTGKEVESPLATVWRFRDGKAIEYFEFYDTAKAYFATQPEEVRR